MSDNMHSKFAIFSRNQILLQDVKKINPDDPNECPTLVKNLVDYELYNESPDNPIIKAALAVMNSIIAQERIFFCLTRDAMQAVIIKDPNFTPQGIGIKNELYAKAMAFLYNDLGVFKELRKGTTRSASAFELIHPEMLAYLKVRVLDPEKQRTEALEYSKKVSSK